MSAAADEGGASRKPKRKSPFSRRELQQLADELAAAKPEDVARVLVECCRIHVPCFAGELRKARLHRQLDEVVERGERALRRGRRHLGDRSPEGQSAWLRAMKASDKAYEDWKRIWNELYPDEPFELGTLA